MVFKRGRGVHERFCVYFVHRPHKTALMGHGNAGAVVNEPERNIFLVMALPKVVDLISTIIMFLILV